MDLQYLGIAFYLYLIVGMLLYWSIINIFKISSNTNELREVLSEHNKNNGFHMTEDTIWTLIKSPRVMTLFIIGYPLLALHLIIKLFFKKVI